MKKTSVLSKAKPQQRIDRHKLVHPDKPRALRANITMETAMRLRNEKWLQHVRTPNSGEFLLKVVPNDWVYRNNRWTFPPRRK